MGCLVQELRLAFGHKVVVTTGMVGFGRTSARSDERRTRYWNRLLPATPRGSDRDSDLRTRQRIYRCGGLCEVVGVHGRFSLSVESYINVVFNLVVLVLNKSGYNVR
jgi:hypothetical protein